MFGGGCLAQHCSPTRPPPPQPQAVPLHLTEQPALLEKPGQAPRLPVLFLSHDAYDCPDIAVGLGLQKKGKFSQTAEHIPEKMGKRRKTQPGQGEGNH